MERYLITFCIIICISCPSCKKDWLEAKANKNQAIPTTLKDFQALLDKTLTLNHNLWGIGEIASDGHYIAEQAWSNATSDPARDAYTWTKKYLYSGPDIQPWDLTYQRIYYSNIVLDGLKKITPSSITEQELWNNIKGQALFNRGATFYFLSQLFAEPFDKNTASGDVGIPLRLNSDITERSIRSTVSQTYEQIINDLKESLNLLSDRALYPTRGSQSAAYGLLARVYLSMDDYDNAYNYSNKCLQLHKKLVDYNTLSTSANYIGLFNDEVIFHDRIITSSYISGFLTINCLIDTALYNEYAVNDLRKTVFFKLNSNGSIRFSGNYNNTTEELFCGIATDEIYLIRAECLARNGNIKDAMSDLNFLLNTRWKNGTFIHYIAADAEDALNQILKERKKELLMRGIRWSDLRRLNKDNRFSIKLSRSIGGQLYELKPKSYQYTFPIPDDIIQQSGITQTPGW